MYYWFSLAVQYPASLWRIRKYLDSDFVFDMVLLIKTYVTNHAGMQFLKYLIFETPNTKQKTRKHSQLYLYADPLRQWLQVAYVYGIPAMVTCNRETVSFRNCVTLTF